MKWSQRVKYVMTQMFHRKISLFSSMIVVTIAFLFLQVVLYPFGERYYNEIAVNQSIRKPDKTYHVKFLDLNMNAVNAEKVKAVIEDIQTKDGVSGGKFYTHNLRFQEFQKEEYYQINHTEWAFELSPEKEELMKQMNVDGLQDMIFLDPQLLPMCEVSLTDGRRAEEVLEEYEGQNPVLVGYDYRNLVTVGQTLTENDSKQKFVVAGILSKDSQWLSYGDIDTIQGPVSLNHFFLTWAREKPMKRANRDVYSQWEDEVDETVYTYYNSIYFMVDGSVSHNEIQSWIQMLEKKHGFPMQCQMITTILRDSITENIRELRLFILSAVVALVVTALSIGMASITSLLIRRKEYAVMSANGFLLGDIKQMIGLENLIKIGIPYVVSNQLMARTWDKPVVAHLCMGISGVYAVILIILCTAIPIFMLKRMNLTELLGGNAND